MIRRRTLLGRLRVLPALFRGHYSIAREGGLSFVESAWLSLTFCLIGIRGR